MDEILQLFLEIIQSGETVPEELLNEMIGLLEEELQTPEGEEAPIPPGAELLWVLSGENPEVFTQYLKTFPDPSINILSRNPAQIQSLIQRFQSQITTPQGEAQDGIAKADLNSSNIYGFRYDPRNSKLFVRFQSGSVYQYDGVPPKIFKMFQAGAVPAKTDGHNQHGMWWKGKIPSLGAAFYKLIRQQDFPYRQLR